MEFDAPVNLKPQWLVIKKLRCRYVEADYRQTPLGHNPPCFLPFVGRLGSGPRLVGRIGSGVRVSVNFQQKYPPSSVLRCPTAAENGVMSKRVVSGRGLTTVSGVTNTSSSSCANNGRRTPSWVLGSTLAAVRSSFIFHTSRLVRLITL